MLSEVLLGSGTASQVQKSLAGMESLSLSDLEKLRDLLGVLDAFEEVNYTLRQVRFCLEAL